MNIVTDVKVHLLVQNYKYPMVEVTALSFTAESVESTGFQGS